QHAYKSLAWGLVLSGQKEKSSEIIDRCIALNPTAASNLGTIGLSLIMQGEYESGFLMLTKAIQLTQDPSACVKLGLALLYYHAGNYEESKKWLDRLPPFELPFATLLSIAIQGRITGKSIGTGELASNLNGQEKDIIERMVLSNELRSDIATGLERAGYTPGDGSFFQLTA
ncbi:MAG: tetratricopeptide repeat protein, partial [Flavisolibacter sp.]